MGVMILAMILVIGTLCLIGILLAWCMEPRRSALGTFASLQEVERDDTDIADAQLLTSPNVVMFRERKFAGSFVANSGNDQETRPQTSMR